MKAVILAGGMGKRLRPYTFSIPKPLLPIGERPILALIIDHLKRFGVDEIILCVGYQAELIEAFCGDGGNFGLRISYVKEKTPLGTAGPLCLTQDKIKADETFIYMNGDIITRLDFGKLIEFHKNSGYEMTIGYTAFNYQVPFGVLKLNEGEIKDIVEKPVSEYSISAGIYCMTGSVIKHVPGNEPFTIPELAKSLIRMGKVVGAYPIEEFWVGLESRANVDEALEEIGRIEKDYLENS